MFWEILLVVILAIGIFTAINEARLKRIHKDMERRERSKEHYQDSGL